MTRKLVCGKSAVYCTDNGNIHCGGSVKCPKLSNKNSFDIDCLEAIN